MPHVAKRFEFRPRRGPAGRSSRPFAAAPPSYEIEDVGARLRSTTPWTQEGAEEKAEA